MKGKHNRPCPICGEPNGFHSDGDMMEMRHAFWRRAIPRDRLITKAEKGK